MTTLIDILPTDTFQRQEFAKRRDRRTLISCGITIAAIVTFIAATTIGIIMSLPVVPAIFLATIVSLIPWLLIMESFPIVSYTMNKQYTKAWNDAVKPKMIQTVIEFDKLSNHLPKNQTNTPEYVEMYTLSEQIREEIRQHPTLTTLTDFDVTPDFIKLNNIMKNYTQNPA